MEGVQTPALPAGALVYDLQTYILSYSKVKPDTFLSFGDKSIFVHYEMLSSHAERFPTPIPSKGGEHDLHIEGHCSDLAILGFIARCYGVHFVGSGRYAGAMPYADDLHHTLRTADYVKYLVDLMATTNKYVAKNISLETTIRAAVMLPSLFEKNGYPYQVDEVARYYFLHTGNPGKSFTHHVVRLVLKTLPIFQGQDSNSRIFTGKLAELLEDVPGLGQRVIEHIVDDLRKHHPGKSLQVISAARKSSLTANTEEDLTVNAAARGDLVKKYTLILMLWNVCGGSGRSLWVDGMELLMKASTETEDDGPA
jgi:hypothetical protein